MLINDAEITGSLVVNASSSFQHIIVSGNILPDTTNERDLGSPDKYFREIYVSTGSIYFVDGDGIVTASLSANTLNSLLQNTSSANDSIVNINSFTQSFSSSVSESVTFLSSSVSTSFGSSDANITSLSSSVSTSFSSSTATVTSLSSSVSTSVTSLSSSLTSVNTTQNNRLGSIESVTGSYATTGSNTFFGTQTFSGSVYIANNLIVQGSSSIQYISASSVSIGTNIVQLNTANPSVRFAGLSIIDSGSIGGSGSFLYDSVQDEFIFVHRGNGTNITSSHFVLGPETIDNLGNETYLTNNRLPKGTGKEHLVDSQISDDGTTVSIGGALTVTGNITGPIRATNGVVSGSSQIDVSSTTGDIALGTRTSGNYVASLVAGTNITLSNNTGEGATPTIGLTNNTISGISLGSNLATLTIGTGLSGTSYNGSTGVTIANSGVTSIVAGTGISINQGTAAVTVTNTITNNNQLTNGAGYITSAGTSANSNSLNGLSATQLFNNMGQVHGTYTNFNSYGDWGFRYMQGSTNGPNTGASQYYGMTLGLGNEYSNYGTQFYWNRTSTGGNPYVSVRFLEGGSWGGWSKIYAGMADGITGALAITGAITATGDITAYYSDGRLKENLKIISNPIEKITKLTGYTYNTNELGKTLLDTKDDNDSKVGLIAQDLQKVLPEAVKLAPFDRDEDGNSKSGENYLTIQYEKIVPLLVEAIKEQQIKIENLTIEVENLKKPKGL